MYSSSREKVTRNYQMIKEKCFDLLSNSLNKSFRKCWKIILENVYVDIRA